MVKLNDFTIPLVIGSIIAIILSKKKTSSALPVISSYYQSVDDAQFKTVQKLETNIQTLQSVKESNLDIAKQILDYEKNLSDLDISKIKNELGKTQSFISQQQKIPYGAPPTWLPNATGKALVSKFDSQFAYNPMGSLFPDINVPMTQQLRAGFLRQANYEQAQENIQKASALVIRQHDEIDRLNEEYQTRFGSLSRYG